MISCPLLWWVVSITMSILIVLIASIIHYKEFNIEYGGHGIQGFCVMLMFVVGVVGWIGMGLEITVKTTYTPVDHVSIVKTKTTTIAELKNGKIIDDNTAVVYTADSIRVIRKDKYNMYNTLKRRYYYMEAK